MYLYQFYTKIRKKIEFLGLKYMINDRIQCFFSIFNHFGELITNAPCVELEYVLWKYLQNTELEKRKLFFYVHKKVPRLIKPQYL